MDPFRLLLSSLILLIIVVEANHVDLEPRAYWRTILPHTPMPSAIEKLLKPDIHYDRKVGTSVKYFGKDTLGSILTTKVYQWHYFKAFVGSDTQLQNDPTAALFFLRKDLYLGKNFTVQLADRTSVTTANFIPRSAAESIPFSAAEFPSILSHFSIPVGSAEAATTKETLRLCEAAPAVGETKLCSTSLESMVDFATMSLGTRDVVALAMTGGSAVGERVAYKVGSVKKVATSKGKGVVACHPMEYAYAVFFCHTMATTEVYEVEMAAAESGRTAVKAVAVCHADTTGWDPKHIAFRVLKVKRGTVPVCHFIPKDHVVWA